MGSTAKITTLDRLLRLRRSRGLERRRIVFTNGVFDIIHAGHVDLLERAKRLGDVLIVGLNTDASARRLGKGPGRPFNSWSDRAKVVAALGCVDAVVAFGEDTPERLLSRLKPEVLVKGADYKASEVAGRRWSGRVVRLTLLKGRSTTALADKIGRAIKTTGLRGVLRGRSRPVS